MKSNGDKTDTQQSEEYIISSDAETELWEGETHISDFYQEKPYKMSKKFKYNQTKGKIRTLKQELRFVKKKIEKILSQGQEENTSVLHFLRGKKYTLNYALFSIYTSSDQNKYC